VISSERGRSRRLPLGLDAFDVGVLAALTAFGFAVLAAMLVRVATKGGVATGADSYVAVDQLQYLNWIRQAGDHLAVENLYDFADSPRSFVHPGVLLGGVLHRLGLGVAPAYHLLKPLAVIAMFAGALLYTRRFLGRGGDRRLALVVALFGISPIAAAVAWSGLAGNETKLRFDFVAGEFWTGNYLWGYVFTSVAVALLPLGLLAYERWRSEGDIRLMARAAAAGLLCSWLQPWQGATFAIILVGAEALGLRGTGTRGVAAAARRLTVPLVATAVPLFYYLVLSLTDSAWELAGSANESGRVPLWVLLVAILPLALPALVAYRRPAADFGEVALRLWPAAALLVYFQPFGTFPAHALQGLAIPLAVLGTLGQRHWLGSRPLPAALVAGVLVVMIVPGTVHRVDQLRGAVNLGLQPFFLTPEEHDALNYLKDRPGDGGVLTTFYSGQAIPAYAERATWVGATSWTPDFELRQEAADRLFAGRLGRSAAERLVRDSGARYLYADCQGHPDIGPLVRGVTGPPRRFGCAAVYEVR
jgi:hypothetical protein